VETRAIGDIAPSAARSNSARASRRLRAWNSFMAASKLASCVCGLGTRLVFLGSTGLFISAMRKMASDPFLNGV
jgi:hypothetical protein